MRKSLTFAASLLLCGGLFGCDDSDQAKPAATAKAVPAKHAEAPAEANAAPRKLHHFRNAVWHVERPSGFSHAAMIPASYTPPPAPYDEMGSDNQGAADASGDYSSDSLNSMSLQTDQGADFDTDAPPPPSDEPMERSDGYAAVPPPPPAPDALPPASYGDSDEDPTAGLTDDARTRADLLSQRHAARQRNRDVWVDGYGVAHPQAGGDVDPPTVSGGETEMRLDPWHAYDVDCPQLRS